MYGVGRDEEQGGDTTRFIVPASQRVEMMLEMRWGANGRNEQKIKY
jgi:hypothetical protein